MGFKDIFRRQKENWDDAKLTFEIGCELLGRPSDITSVSQRAERMTAGRKELARRTQIRTVANNAIQRVLRESMAQQGRDTQFEQDGIKVLVKNGYSRNTDSYTTDIIVIDPGRRGQHLHMIVSEQGTILHEEWTTNH
ncbi:hypothetical protein [Amycolatopsis sp. w19]|uniref:hypothetical protein n=1 Tax=Amycolatopsis sp. w19 TaxID=3448134 RepID=UPI003F1E044C